MPQYEDSAQQIEFTRDSKLSKLSLLSFLAMVGGFWVFFGGPVKSICAWLPAMVLGVYSWVSIKHSGGQLKGKFFAVTATIIPSICIIAGCALFFVWRVDTEPIEVDLSVADLYSADAKYADSFDLLSKLAGTETKAVLGVSEKLVSGNASDMRSWLIANKSKILSDWEEASDARGIIESLDGFGQIADMTDPNMSNFPEEVGNLMYLSEVYSGYGCLQNQLGFGVEGVEHLVQFDSVLKKIHTHARESGVVVMCGLLRQQNVVTANYIVNCPNTDRKSLEMLSRHFKPMANDYTSLRNGVIFDYLQSKDMIYAATKKMPFWILKPNSLCRVLRNYCDDNLAILGSVEKHNSQRFSVWPGFYPKKIRSIEVSVGSEIPFLYHYYSPFATILIEESAVFFGKKLASDVNHKVLNDLLLISLNKRLGKDVSLKARAYSDEYVIDVEKKIIFSPGPDGEQFTEDDIKLFIDPAVLKL